MRYHGKSGQVSIEAAIVLSLNKWTLNMATDKADVTAFGDANKQYVQGLKDLKGNVAGWFDDEEDALFVASDAIAPADLELMPVASVATIKWSGPAWLDANIDVPANGPITVSGDFVAAGPWTRVFTAPVGTTARARGEEPARAAPDAPAAR